jgi:hypothetical protein
MEWLILTRTYFNIETLNRGDLYYLEYLIKLWRKEKYSCKDNVNNTSHKRTMKYVLQQPCTGSPLICFIIFSTVLTLDWQWDLSCNFWPERSGLILIVPVNTLVTYSAPMSAACKEIKVLTVNRGGTEGLRNRSQLLRLVLREDLYLLWQGWQELMKYLLPSNTGDWYLYSYGIFFN